MRSGIPELDPCPEVSQCGIPSDPIFVLLATDSREGKDAPISDCETHRRESEMRRFKRAQINHGEAGGTRTIGKLNARRSMAMVILVAPESSRDRRKRKRADRHLQHHRGEPLDGRRLRADEERRDGVSQAFSSQIPRRSNALIPNRSGTSNRSSHLAKLHTIRSLLAPVGRDSSMILFASSYSL